MIGNYKLPAPTAIEELSYEKILADNIAFAKELVPNWEPIESDAYLMLLESQSYKELHFRAFINELVKKMLPHYSSGSDLDNFIFGFYGGIRRIEDEDDEEFLDRAILSINRFSTAGSTASYEYHAYRADARVDDVKVLSHKAGEVTVYVASKEVIELEMLEKVYATLNDKKVRPLTDRVFVQKAVIKEVLVGANLELFDLAEATLIREQIESNFAEFFKIGEDVIYSKLISMLHIKGVYSVISNAKADTVIADTEIAKITLSLNFVQGVLR